MWPYLHDNPGSFCPLCDEENGRLASWAWFYEEDDWDVWHSSVHMDSDKYIRLEDHEREEIGNGEMWKRTEWARIPFESFEEFFQRRKKMESDCLMCHGRKGVAYILPDEVGHWAVIEGKDAFGGPTVFVEHHHENRKVVHSIPWAVYISLKLVYKRIKAVYKGTITEEMCRGQ